MKYTYINFNKLPNKDFDGFHKRVADAGFGITNEDGALLLSAYNEDIEKFHSYVENFDVTEAKALAKDTDVVRIKAFATFRNMVRTVRTSMETSDAALGEEIWKTVKEYSRSSTMTQNVLTGVIKNSINVTDSLIAQEAYAKSYVSSGIKPVFEKLKAAETAYESADQTREKNRTDRKQLSNMGAREACIKDYKALVGFAMARVLTKSDAECETFLAKVEDIVKFSRSLYMSRDGRRAKDKDGEDSTKVEEAAETKTPASTEINNGETAVIGEVAA